ncbi:MAG: type II toxin-antitoxin system PemK/MazF family toxin, partial [Patescibacteria group bacterium]
MSQFIKNFIEWFSIKIRLNNSIHVPPLFNEGEIWWCSIGENVGGEISGKGTYFRRPLLIIRKLDKFSFIGIPLTSQHKVGTWYFNLKVKNKDNFVILPQIRHIDYRRMDKILCTIDNSDFSRWEVPQILDTL